MRQAARDVCPRDAAILSAPEVSGNEPAEGNEDRMWIVLRHKNLVAEAGGMDAAGPGTVYASPGWLVCCRIQGSSNFAGIVAHPDVIRIPRRHGDGADATVGRGLD